MLLPSRVCRQNVFSCKSHVAVDENSTKIGDCPKVKRLFIAVGLALGLLFLSECYHSLSVVLKLASLLLTLGCFLSVAWRHRIAGLTWLYLFLVASFLFVQFVYTGLNYHQSITQFFTASYYYFYCLLVPVFAFIFEIIGLKEALIKLEKVVFLIATFMLIAGFLYLVLGFNITEIDRFRNGLLRINAPFVLQIGCVIAAYLFACDKKNKILHALTCALAFFAILFVYQSRLVLLLMVSIFLFIFALRRKENVGVTLTGIFLSLFILLLLFAVGPFGEILGSFAVTSESGGNTLTRIYETDHYLELFKRYPLNGIGLVPYGSKAYTALSGPFGSYYVDDVGIIGALAEIGLWIIPIYIVPMFVFMVWAFSEERNELRIMLLAIFLYLVGTTFTTLIVFPYFDPTWSLCIALFGYKEDQRAAPQRPIRIEEMSKLHA